MHGEHNVKIKYELHSHGSALHSAEQRLAVLENIGLLAIRAIERSSK
jgi:hypothetical protein